jgi:hypothetical protein
MSIIIKDNNIFIHKDNIEVVFPVKIIPLTDRSTSICHSCPYNCSTQCLDIPIEEICTKLSIDLGEFDWYPEISQEDIKILRRVLKKVLFNVPGIIKKKRIFKRSKP